jgi:16S rRNA processing protein RimM
VLVVVGVVGKPHGLRGGVSIALRTDEPEVRFAPGAVLLCSDGNERTVATSQWHGNRLIVTFAGVVDRTGAEALRGLVLEVERNPHERPADPNEFFDSDLNGARVELVDGSHVGEVAEVVHLPAQDLLAVRTEHGEVLVPFVTEIVPEVDLVNRVIRIDPPPGLLVSESDD